MLQEILISAIVVQAVANNLCNLLLKAGYGVASKRFRKWFWNEPHKLDDMLTSLLLLPNQQSSPFFLQDTSLSLPESQTSYIRSGDGYGLYLPKADMSFSDCHLNSLDSFIQDDINFLGDMNFSGIGNEWILKKKILSNGYFLKPKSAPIKNGFSVHATKQNDIILSAMPMIYKVLLLEREKQINDLRNLISLAIRNPLFHAEAFQNKGSITMNFGSDASYHDLRGGFFSGGFAETVYGQQTGMQNLDHSFFDRSFDIGFNRSRNHYHESPFLPLSKESHAKITDTEKFC